MPDLRIVCLSDTHGQHERLTGDFAVPDGDVLVCAGDTTARGTLAESLAFLHWFAAHPHHEKVLVAGNHDAAWADRSTRHDLDREAWRLGVTYLAHHAGTTRKTGLAVFGSPWTPEFMNWHFMYPRYSRRAEELWQAVPGGLDLLVTHGPPFGTLDRTGGGILAGCSDLALAVNRARPRLHVFGHIHEAAGVVTHAGTVSVNASVIDERYRLARGPVVVCLPADGPAVLDDA